MSVSVPGVFIGSKIFCRIECFECVTVNSSSVLNVFVSVSQWFPVLFCYQYTMQDLLERIQASEEELKAHLEAIHACQIDGKQ